MRPPVFPSDHAMTLVETLVALGIVLVLAVALFSAFRGATEKGREVRCLANQRAIIQAALAFAGEHNGTLPGNLIEGAGDGAGMTHQKLSPYLNIEWINTPRWRAQWFCPSRASGFEMFPFSNYAFTTEIFGFGLSSQPPPVKIHAINHPHKTAAFACVIGNYTLFHQYGFTHTADPPVANTALGQLAPWHSGGTIITFMDGHSRVAESFGSSDPRRHWFSLNHPNAP